MGVALPHLLPMQTALRGSKVEVSTDLPTEVPPEMLRTNDKPRGVQFRSWIVIGSAC